MRIVLTGGGSGGHITPILAIASEIKKLQPNAEVIYIGQKGDSLADIPAAHVAIDAVYAVWAGKFRRYHGEGARQLFDIETQALNVRDAFRVFRGILESFWLLRKLKPAVIFTRGGFVSVPVALGGKLNRIPYITHDSDSTPSLANRVIARWAKLHAVALPAELYSYPRSKTVVTGVPVGDAYVPVTQKIQHLYRQELGVERYTRIILVTGGGNGAAPLNRMIVQNAERLLVKDKDLAIIHLTGRALVRATRDGYDAALSADNRRRVIVKGHVTNLYQYSGAADVILARGGATGLAEFAIQGKACVIVPAKQLIWQVRHAEALASKHAIVILSEAESEKDGILGGVLMDLLADAAARQKLGATLARFAHPHAAHDLAVLLLEQASIHT